ncbi:MAG: hypothetical protein E6K54_05220 [Gammaproteobacteria bacterium]|nr:MAG: hypothetical protein E6K54_05220 [Gammaproteobacteria bacterium]
MLYSTIRSWSLTNLTRSPTFPLDFYLDLSDSAKRSPALEQAIRQAANILNRLLFPLFQFKVDTLPVHEKNRHIIIDGYGCNAQLGAREDTYGNKWGYMSCFIGGGWRGNWKTHNVDSIIHELLHTIGREHEHLQAESQDLIHYLNSNHQLRSRNFLEYYDAWSPMHYSLSLIRVVIGGGSIPSKTSVIQSLMKQAYPPKLAEDYYQALLGLDENSFSFDAFNLGFGLLTQRDFNTLRKTACIIDASLCEFKKKPPLFAFISPHKISYRYLLQLTKIFTDPWYQTQKLIVRAETKELEIQSDHCYIVKLKDLFQVYPKEDIHCAVITTVLKGSQANLQFLDSDFPRKGNDSCTLMIEKGFLNFWNSSLQSQVTFYSTHPHSTNASNTLQLSYNNTQTNTPLNLSPFCISIPDQGFFNKTINVLFNGTWTPFFNSEDVPGADYFYERNKYFSRLAWSAAPFFFAGLGTGITRRAELTIFNKNIFKSSIYFKHLIHGIKSLVQISLTSYAIYLHIIEEKARQLLIPLLDENKQLFQTADLMDKLNNDAPLLSLILPYTVNATMLLASLFITSIKQHWTSRLGFTNALAILIACIANQGNPYSYIELGIGVSVYTTAALFGYGLTATNLSILSKLKIRLALSRLNFSDITINNKENMTNLMFEEKEVNIRSQKESQSLTKALRKAWNIVSVSKFVTALSHTSFFTQPKSLEEPNNTNCSERLQLEV